MSLLSFFILFFALSVPTLAQLSDSEPENIYGQPLELCSSAGMALSGFTRSGSCVNLHDDIGSHHICINLSSTTGGNFCKVTGQPDWCSSELPCHGASDKLCPIQNWCVCQWAFASYIHYAGGCDNILDIKCEAVNKHAILAYRKSDKYKEALECIEKKCGIM